LDGAVGEDRGATYAAAADVASILGDEETDDVGVVYVARMPDGPPVVLRDSGALIWEVAVGGGTMDEIVSGVAARTGLPAEAIQADVREFVRELSRLGLLVEGCGADDA
jgi:hypothetical protein